MGAGELKCDGLYDTHRNQTAAEHRLLTTVAIEIRLLLNIGS